VHQGSWRPLIDEVNRLRADPAVLAYHLFDEAPTHPGPFAPEVLVEHEHWKGAYDTIKRADPVRAVYPNNIASGHACTYVPLNGTRATYDFRPYSDIWAVDAYMIFSSTTNLEEMVRRHDLSLKSCRFGGGPAKPYMFLAQAYHERGPAGERVRPEPQQMRALMYSAIVHGATALAYFPFHTTWIVDSGDLSKPPWYVDRPNWGGLSPEVSPELWREITDMNYEIETLKPMIFAKTSRDVYHIFVKPGNATTQHPIHTLLKEGDAPQTQYLFAVNIDSQPIETKFTFGRRIARVTPMLEAGEVSIAEREFGETLEGYGVRVYRIDFAS
jgi:hypothetical protein